MSVLEFNCRFHYPSGFALDFAFQAGEGVTALVGPSGSGKTTVLNLTAGLLRPEDGVIRLRDRVLFDSRSKVNVPPEKRGIGYVFQDYQLFPHMSVGENLRYGERRTGRGSIGFDKMVALLELSELVDRRPATLSGGQKQRVAIGRALLRNPALLLLDEPLSAVHRQLRESVLNYLIRVAEEFHLPTLLVSHDSESVAAVAGSVVPIGPDS
jgi:molybdate transport system ATP-binding protein